MATSDPTILSISQLTRRIKGLLENDVGTVWLSGEISNWRVAASGHAYFTLKDEDSQIDAVMFRGALNSVRFGPDNGMEVLAQGRVTVYEKRGNYQIILNELQPRGVGALQLAFERLKKKLDAEGLFDQAHKKPLPLLPKRIGIVTSPTGAAIRDILNVLGRRFANVHVLLYPARVQGEGAAPEIVRGIQALDRLGVDVMIVGRGGGSLEDLWPFNEEIVVRAIFAAQTPVIAAVGHEIDFTLADFVADLRAPTPSAAAELVVREQQALVDALAQLRRRMAQATARRVERARHRIAVVRGSYAFARPDELIRQRRQQADELRMRLEDAMGTQAASARKRLDHAHRAMALLSPVARLRQARARLESAQGRIARGLKSNVVRYRHRCDQVASAVRLLSPAPRLAATHEQADQLRARLLRAAQARLGQARGQLGPRVAQLEALSPLSILARGYAVAWKLPEERLVRSAAELTQGDRIRVRLGQGSAEASVLRVIPSDEISPP